MAAGFEGSSSFGDSRVAARRGGAMVSADSVAMIGGRLAAIVTWLTSDQLWQKDLWCLSGK